MPTAITCPGPVACLAGIFRLLVAGFMDRAPVVFPPGALVDAVWRRIQRLAARFRGLATTPRRAAPAGPRTPRAPSERTQTGPRRPPDPLTTWRVTQEHGWLTTMMPGIDAAAEAFDAFLRTSGPDDLLEADPRYAGLLFRLGRMLGVAEDLLPPPHWPEPPAGPEDLRPAPRGDLRRARVNEPGYALVEARLRPATERPAPDPACKNG
ncbi:MAG: hypothetical protein KGI51_14415 [Rhodospirillales bacterium]|nr:hypothetical protein [Rhodospirillales bacterium]